MVANSETDEKIDVTTTTEDTDKKLQNNVSDDNTSGVRYGAMFLFISFHLLSLLKDL